MPHDAKSAARWLPIPTVICAMFAACAPNPRVASVPQTASDESSAPTVTVDLTYYRPPLFNSASAPGPFFLIANYPSRSDAVAYTGQWNDETQTLSASVAVPLRAENLVFVQDDALTPGAATEVKANRGVLKEVACPNNVDAINSCLLLQVLR